MKMFNTSNKIQHSTYTHPTNQITYSKKINCFLNIIKSGELKFIDNLIWQITFNKRSYTTQRYHYVQMNINVFIRPAFKRELIWMIMTQFFNTTASIITLISVEIKCFIDCIPLLLWNYHLWFWFVQGTVV